MSDFYLFQTVIINFMEIHSWKTSLVCHSLLLVSLFNFSNLKFQFQITEINIFLMIFYFFETHLYKLILGKMAREGRFCGWAFIKSLPLLCSLLCARAQWREARAELPPSTPSLMPPLTPSVTLQVKSFTNKNTSLSSNVTLFIWIF